MSDDKIDTNTPLVKLSFASPLIGEKAHWDSGSVVPAHHHDTAQLVYASGGVITVETDDGIWTVPPTQAVWIPAGKSHSHKISGQVRLLTLQIDPNFAPIPGNACRVVQVTAVLRAAIFRAIEFPEGYSHDSAEAHLATVILDEIVAAETAPLHLPMPIDNRARQVALAIRIDPSIRQPHKEWARKAGASERTLERLFVTETGMSFGKWQTQARLLHALHLIALGESISSASLDVGFQSPSAFIAMFRNVLGTTPSKYFATIDENSVRAFAAQADEGLDSD